MMMTKQIFERRLAAAYQELHDKGQRLDNVYPPMYRMCNKFGLLLPPPLYRKFWANLVFSGGFFALCYSFVTWLLFGQIIEKTVTYALFELAFATLTFGGLMASYYAYRRHRLKLTHWERLGS